MVGIIGKKLGMTEVFDDKGDCIPVTLFEAGPCFVTQKGSKNIQVGFQKKSKQNKAGTRKQFAYIGEVPLDPKKEWKKGDEIKVDTLAKVPRVDVVGVSKGKGFTGVVKRYNFKGGPKSHGHRHVLKSPGSTGACAYPGRVFKGKKMAGQSGNKQVTVKGLKVIKIDSGKNILAVKGSVPGRNGSVVKIIASDSKKKVEGKEKN